MHPLVSIIIPSLNQGKFIKQTLESIFSQDYPNIEVIVMDGGSHDQTIKILTNYELRIKNKKYRNVIHFRWESKRDRGQASAINKGLRMAKGDIVGYLNSDDYLEQGAITKIVNIFQKNQSIKWVTGDCRIVNEQGKEIQSLVRFYKCLLRLLPLSVILPIANPIAQPGTFWKKEVHNKIGYFDEALRYVFDYDFWIRMSKMYQIKVTPAVLSAFRIHKQSKGSRSYMSQFEEELAVSKRYFAFPPAEHLHRLHASLTVWTYNRIK